MNDERHLEQLTRSQALDLLASVPIGRLVFTDQALPAIRPLNHLVEGESIVVRTAAGATITTVAGRNGVVVAYEADELDTARQVGWSVVIVGTARLLDDEAAAERYRSLLRPWLSGPRDEVITIAADIVTGYRMVPGDPADSGQQLRAGSGPGYRNGPATTPKQGRWP
jgi:nitroimidazol reductase NimA-like FMN-containing flavoprotein (pyridoxamine 5'-phosphate oxidase superfamily)